MIGPTARRQHQPTQPQRRRERLAGRPHVDHPVGRQPLQRAERSPVIAILGVVVVFDHQPPGAGPLQQRRAPRRRQRHARRRLVGRRQRQLRAAGRSLSTRAPARRRGAATRSAGAGRTTRCGGSPGSSTVDVAARWAPAHGRAARGPASRPSTRRSRRARRRLRARGADRRERPAQLRRAPSIRIGERAVGGRSAARHASRAATACAGMPRDPASRGRSRTAAGRCCGGGAPPAIAVVSATYVPAPWRETR